MPGENRSCLCKAVGGDPQGRQPAGYPDEWNMRAVWCFFKHGKSPLSQAHPPARRNLIFHLSCFACVLTHDLLGARPRGAVGVCRGVRRTKEPMAHATGPSRSPASSPVFTGGRGLHELLSRLVPPKKKRWPMPPAPSACCFCLSALPSSRGRWVFHELLMRLAHLMTGERAGGPSHAASAVSGLVPPV